MKKLKGFTFIENMAIVTVLAIVIVLVLPKLMHFQSKVNKQLAIRRAITNYQVILTKELMGASGLRTTSDADEYLQYDNYSGIVDRFDVKNKDCNDDNHSCSFLTASGNKWDVSIPSRTLISLKDKKPTLNDAKNSNNTDTFIIPFEVIRGNLKIMFNKSDNDTDTRAAISKTLSFINE